MTIHHPIARRETIKLRIEDFEMLDRAGAFDDWAKVELIDGKILGMNAQAMPHMRMKMALYNELRDAIRAANLPYHVFTEGTVAFPDHDAPEPDVLVIDRAEGEGYVQGEWLSLVVEVADTTLANDLGPKANLYAGLGVPEYWVADVNGGVLHQMWEPASDGYRQRRQVAFGEAVRSVALPGIGFVLPERA